MISIMIRITILMKIPMMATMMVLSHLLRKASEPDNMKIMITIMIIKIITMFIIIIIIAPFKESPRPRPSGFYALRHHRTIISLMTILMIDQ